MRGVPLSWFKFLLLWPLAIIFIMGEARLQGGVAPMHPANFFRAEIFTYAHVDNKNLFFSIYIVILVPLIPYQFKFSL